MGLKFVIKYHEDVVREDIPKIAKTWKTKIRKSVENKLTTEPEIFGKPLRKSLRGYRSLRVGDYRIIFRIEKIIVKIFVIQHRSVAYKNIEKRVHR